MEKIKGNFICVYEGESKAFSSKDEFERSDKEKNGCVPSIAVRDGIIFIELKKWISPITDMNSEWIKEHETQFGTAPGFF